VVFLGAPTATGKVGVEVVGTDEVLDVQERGALLADVDEGGLEAREDAGDLAEDDVPDAAGVLVARALDVELGDDAVLDEGDACFFGFYTDYEEILGHDGCFPAWRSPVR
jgi:hypothetical protein